MSQPRQLLDGQEARGPEARGTQNGRKSREATDREKQGYLIPMAHTSANHTAVSSQQKREDPRGEDEGTERQGTDDKGQTRRSPA
jgi:hypothetical protein